MGELVNARRDVREIWERGNYIERKNILTSLYPRSHNKNMVRQMARVNWISLPDNIKEDLTSYNIGRRKVSNK